MVVLTSGKGLEHALIIRRNKHTKKNQVEPVPEITDQPEKELLEAEAAKAEAEANPQKSSTSTEQ